MGFVQSRAGGEIRNQPAHGHELAARGVPVWGQPEARAGLDGAAALRASGGAGEVWGRTAQAEDEGFFHERLANDSRDCSELQSAPPRGWGAGAGLDARDAFSGTVNVGANGGKAAFRPW